MLYLCVGVSVSDEADKRRGAVLTRQVRRTTAHQAHLQAPHKTPRQSMNASPREEERSGVHGPAYRLWVVKLWGGEVVGLCRQEVAVRLTTTRQTTRGGV